MDWRDILPKPQSPPSEPALDPPRVQPVPTSFAERVRIAELQLNATENRMQPSAREVLRHSVEHLRDLASGYRDEEVSERMLTAFEQQLRREMTRG